MNIPVSKYIFELLHLNECVILPDFGGFIANYKEAIIDTKKGNITPPGKALFFNANLMHDDGLLINHIASYEKIPHSEVKKYIRVFVNDLKAVLSKGEKVAFDRIGTFHYDKQLNLHFSVSGNNNFLLDSYGFSSLRIPANMNMKNIESTQTIYMDQLQKRRIILRAAAISVPIILAVSAIQFQSKFLKTNQQNFSSLNPVEQVIQNNDSKETSEEKDTLQVDQVVDDMTKPQNALFYSEQEIEDDIKPIDRGNYYLIAGSFKDTMHANRLRDQLISEGYTSSEVLSTKDGRIRVTYNIYHDKFQALQELTRIRKEKNDKSVWLLTIKE